MKIKEALPFLERTLEALRTMPEDIEIISVDTSLYCSEQYTKIQVTGSEDMKQLAPAYGRCIRREVEEPNESGEVWTWLRFSDPDNFLRFVQCECKRAAPSDATTGDGRA